MAKTIYCTISAANYLPRVQVLRDSLAKQGHTDLRVLLIEHPGRVKQIQNDLPDYRFVSPEQVGVPQWVHMAFYYNILEYSTALKPAFIRSLMPEGNVVYLDPDIEVFSPLTEIEESLETHDIVVTPHVSKPLPDDGKSPHLREIVKKGQFNLGFIGVKSTPANQALMDWWQDVLIEGAAHSERVGTFTDQFWAAILVSFAERSHILRSARYNLAYWNIGLHNLSWDGSSTPQTEDGPLGFYHYSGVSRERISDISVHQNREHALPGSPLFRLLTQYVNQLDTSPLSRFSKYPYSFSHYSTQQPILQSHRLAFLHLSALNRKQVLNPFAAPEYIAQIMANSPLVSDSDFQALYITVSQCLQSLQLRMNRFPYSLIKQTEWAINQVAPGSVARVYNFAQAVSTQLYPKLSKLRRLVS